MSKLKLVTVDGPNAEILHEDLTDWKTPWAVVESIANAVKRFCRINRGIGVAAPQMGLRMNFFYLDGTLFSPNRNMFAIHPKILKYGPATKESVEGCLSIPGKQFRLTRHSSIDVSYDDLFGVEQKATLFGRAAIAFQHEHDHLRGLLISRGEPV